MDYDLVTVLPDEQHPGCCSSSRDRGRIKLSFAFLSILTAQLLSGIGAACAADLQASLVGVNSYRASHMEHAGTGFVVRTAGNDSFVVTSGNLLAESDTVTVNVPNSGAELVATQVLADDASGVVILRVTGLALPAVTFGRRDPEQGDLLWAGVYSQRTAGSVDLFKGSVSRTYMVPTADGQVQMFIHNVPIGDTGVGSPLLNDCSEAIGITISSPGAGSGVAYALKGSSLVGVLRRASVAVNVSADTCLSLVEQARINAELASSKAIEAKDQAVQAMSKADRLAEQLQNVNRQNETLREQTREAQSRADQAIEAASGARQDAEQARVEVDRRAEQLKSETQTMIQAVEEGRRASEAELHARFEEEKAKTARREALYWGAISLFLILFAVTFVLMRRHLAQSDRAEDEEDAPIRPRLTTEMQTPNLTEYILDGEDEHGIRYLLRISGDQLSTPQGAVIGRNPPDSPYVINHSDVSRKHARLRIIKNRLFIEDLGSTNGTTVNGQSIEQKGSVTLSNGDQIIMGSVVLRLRSIPG